MKPQPLTRAALAEREPFLSSAPPPARIVHLGLGHFFRAHQAWYTAHAADAPEWGIAAFTGRSARAAQALTAQDGLYTLAERGADGDRVEVVTSIVEARPGSDIERLADLVASPAVAVVTLTVTESGYRLLPDGRPNLEDPAVAADLEDLRSGVAAGRTVLGRLVTALAARRVAEAGPIAIVPCDNIPGNGAFVRRGVTEFASLTDPSLAAWLSSHVSFVSTSVDRITPHVDRIPAAVAADGWIDELPVETEAFSDWVLAGDFPAGRPDWESAGATFVADIEPWEQRKLWLLNGAHSILTFAGLLRGYVTVAEAIADPTCRRLVEEFWDEAVQCLPVGTEHIAYRQQLIQRFENPRIVHRLEQIAAEATVKVQFRFAAVAECTLAAGRDPQASVRAIATWIDWVLTRSRPADARAEDISAAALAADPVAALLALISDRLAHDPDVVGRVRAAGGAGIPVSGSRRASRPGTASVPEGESYDHRQG